MRKLRNGHEVHFEGSYGYSLDVVTRGWQRLAHQELDEVLSTPHQPVHKHERAEPLTPGAVTRVQIPLLPHATRFLRGDVLLLELQGRWLFPRDPFRGQFPAGYQRGPAARCTVHYGGSMPSHLLLGARPVQA